MDADTDFFDRAWKDIEDWWNNNQSTTFDSSKDIYLALVQSNQETLCVGNSCKANGAVDALGGGKAMVLCKGEGNIQAVLGTITHELGHAFGLRHDFSVENIIMSYERDTEKLTNNQFSDRSRSWLSRHPAFSSYQPSQIDNPTEITVTGNAGNDGIYCDVGVSVTMPISGTVQSSSSVSCYPTHSITPVINSTDISQINQGGSNHQ